MAFNVGDPTTAFVLRTGKVLERLSEERLSVKGLPEKKYTWKIDDKKVGDFTSQELAAGINLGAQVTPMLQQALEVMDLTRLRSHLYFVRRHDLQWAIGDMASTHAAAKTLDDVIDHVRLRQRAAAITKPHRFALVPTSASEKQSKPDFSGFVREQEPHA